MHTSTHGLRCDKPPVVALHGGPSMTHLSLKPLVLLADEGHPVILYDQVGCGVNPNPNPDPALDPDPDGPNPNPDPNPDSDPNPNPDPDQVSDATDEAIKATEDEDDVEASGFQGWTLEAPNPNYNPQPNPDPKP